MTHQKIKTEFEADTPAGAPELKAALEGLVNDIGDTMHAMQQKFLEQEKKMTQFDRQMRHRANRPALEMAAQETAPHQKAFSAYLRTGDDDGLRGLTYEGKSLNTVVAAEGGYLADPQTSDLISATLSEQSSIRSIANVVTVEATSYDVLVDHTEMGAGWAGETADTAETSTPGIDRISIPLHELSALPKASQRLLDDSAFDVEGWLAAKVATKFFLSEAEAFVNGDGVDKPKGFMTYPTTQFGSGSWGEIEYIKTNSEGEFAPAAPADAIVDLVYALGAPYRANASFVMNSRTAGAVRKLKDADGRFLWSDGLAAGQPARLLGFPVMIAEDMPDIASGSDAVAFGDFRAGYTVAERPDLRVLRDPFSAKPHVLFYATKRVGGAVTDFNAIKLLRFAI